MITKNDISVNSKKNSYKIDDNVLDVAHSHKRSPKDIAANIAANIPAGRG